MATRIPETSNDLIELIVKQRLPHISTAGGNVFRMQLRHLISLAKKEVRAEIQAEIEFDLDRIVEIYKQR